MARMPKCSGPTAWTRGVSRPLGFCSTKPFLALAGGADRRRGMGFSFQEEGCCILNPKGRVGKERDFFAQLTPIPRSLCKGGRKRLLYRLGRRVVHLRYFHAAPSLRITRHATLP